MQFNIKRGGLFGLDARVAMLIIAILGLFIYPTVAGLISKARVEAILASTRSVTVAIEAYIDDTKSIPNTKDQLFTTLPTKGTQSAKWNGPYLKGESTGRFVPNLVWTLIDDDCSSSTKTSRYCTYRVSYDFCKFPKAVFEKLKDYYASSDQWTSYNAGTECVRIDYGYAKSGLDETYVSFKVKEKP